MLALLRRHQPSQPVPADRQPAVLRIHLVLCEEPVRDRVDPDSLFPIDQPCGADKLLVPAGGLGIRFDGNEDPGAWQLWR